MPVKDVMFRARQSPRWRSPLPRSYGSRHSARVPMVAVIPIPNTVIAGNRVTNEYYGIVSYNAVKLDGLPSNKLDVTVPTKIQ